MVELRHCFEQLLSHLYRQQALHVIARPALRHMQDDFDPASPFSKQLHSHLICCFDSFFGIQRQM